jgi:hypothetical protein
MELTRFAGPYQLSCILERCRPVKTMPEGFTDQRAGLRMTSTLASMDLRE